VDAAIAKDGNNTRITEMARKRAFILHIQKGKAQVVWFQPLINLVREAGGNYGNCLPRRVFFGDYAANCPAVAIAACAVGI
jgi:hypothetical protein